MNHCKYCAQTKTKLDQYGYCIIYDCLERSGLRKKLNELIKAAGDSHSFY